VTPPILRGFGPVVAAFFWDTLKDFTLHIGLPLACSGVIGWYVYGNLMRPQGLECWPCQSQDARGYNTAPFQALLELGHVSVMAIATLNSGPSSCATNKSCISEVVGWYSKCHAVATSSV
jgi:hypothetical protein